MQGASPLASPGLEPRRHLQSLPDRYPQGAEPVFRHKNGRKCFPLDSAGSQGEGDRGRWNYPSHATAAFEMVLSPGAGIASAASGSVAGMQGAKPLA